MTAFVKPKIYYNNVLRASLDGNDGTAYASCAKAIEYPLNRNKVLGEITNATDISALSSLIGAEAMFTSTGNKYRITDAPAYPSMPSSQQWKDICWNGSIFCAIAFNSSLAATSPDGITWTERTLPSSAGWKSISWNGSVFCIIATSSTSAATSPDGITWTAQTLPSSAGWSEIAWNRSVFCIIASSSTAAATSPDGITWTARTLPSSAGWSAIAWNGSVFCIIASNSTSAATSPDGITWTARTLPSSALWSSIAWNGSVFCSIATTSTNAATSPDGITWTARTLPSSNSRNDISWNGSIFCVVEYSSNSAITSPDGITWTAQTLPSSAGWNAIAWNGSVFCAIAFSSSLSIISPDGIIWPRQILSTYESMQDADLGGAFTIKSGLSCAQASATRPVYLIADNHLTPRFTGTLNTAHSIRVHAPNFVQDGGFESGAFAPNWSFAATWSINTANKLEGAYSAAWNTASDGNLYQSIDKKVIKGKTYRVCVKSKSLTGNANAGCITIGPSAASGAFLDNSITGNYIAPTTTATWTEFDFTPEFTTDNWKLSISAHAASKGSATAIIIDEIYLYEKRSIDTLIIGAHNWNLNATIIVNAWRVSPLRSTATSDANNKTQIGNFSVNSSDTILQALTQTYYPVIEIVLPAVAGWTPEAGEAYMGEGWTLPKYPKAFDPYATDDSRLRSMTLSFAGLPPAYRKLNIEDLFTKLRADESIWVTHDQDLPLLMEDQGKAKTAAYNPWTVDLNLTLVEKL